MMNTKLSIITINYNNVVGLKKTMESVLSQTSTEFEYIVVDGGSKDGSKEVIAYFANNDKRIEKWVSEPDEGIYHAMNKGIQLATGEYCQFLNSGDCFVNQFVVEKMLQNTSDSSFVYGNKIKIFQDGRRIIEKENNLKSFYTFFNGSLNHATTLIKRDLFDKYGCYDQSLKIVSDWKFFLITIGLNNELVEYRDVDVVYFDMTGISNSNKDLEKKERDIVLQAVLPKSILSDYNEFTPNLSIIREINSVFVLRKILEIFLRFVFFLKNLFN